MADDNTARKLDSPAEDGSEHILRLQPHPDPNPRYEEFLARTNTPEWEEILDVPADKRQASSGS